MRRWWFVPLFLLAASTAQGNPYILDPSSAIAFAVVALFALIVEAGVVALLLFFSGLSILPAFIGYCVTNVLVFLFVFWPLLDTLPLLPLELLVVVADATAIKLIACIETVQGEDFNGLKWSRALVVSSTGNAISYFIGVIASRSPWERHV